MSGLRSIGLSHQAEELILASQHTDPPAGSMDEPSEVLSEATDLDVLMEAILHDRIAVPDSVAASAEVLGNIEPAVAVLPTPTSVTPSSPAKYPDASVVIASLPDEHVDAWGFAPEEPQNAFEIAPELGVVRQPGHDLRGTPTPRRTWRDLLRGSISKRWTIVGALLATGLITVSAISLRGEPTQTTRRSFDGRGPVRQQPPGQRTRALRPRVATEAEIRSPASKSDAVGVTGAQGANKRPNPATDDRTTPTWVETRDVTAPLTWPIVMSPDTLEGVAEGSDAVTTPPQLLTGGSPEYSAALRTAGIGGSVEVRLTIASDGKVVDVHSITGPTELRSIAEGAVRHWRYQAARAGNRPVETQTSVSFYFDPSAKIALIQDQKQPKP